MSRLARVSIARPKLVLAIFFSAVGLLALAGLKLEDHLHRSNLILPGTTTDRAAKLLKSQGMQSFDLVVLLEGPPTELVRQGSQLAAALDREPKVAVLAPWMPGASAALRRGRNNALLIVRASRSFEDVSRHLAPKVRQQVRRLLHPPVHAYVSGYADIANGIHGGTVTSIEKGELIAAPLLVIVLLLVFRSPIAAALPLLIGFNTIGATRGVLDLVNRLEPLDVLSLNVATMMALALGVDYALLLVSRFREEVAGGAGPEAAAVAAVATAGHTIVAAGAALAATALCALVVVPGALLTSVAFGLLIAIVLSVVFSLVALPAVFSLLGTGIDRWSFGRAPVARSAFGVLALRALRRPLVATGIVLLVMALVAAPALGLETGPPDPRGLAAGSIERSDYLQVRKVLGAGWIAPYEIEVVARHGALTDPHRLSALDRFQRDLVARRDVQAVLGPGQIASRTAQIHGLPRQLRRANDALKSGRRQQQQLADGLRRAGDGVTQLRRGLADAASGAGQLQAGGGNAAAGAEQVHAGIAHAEAGAQLLSSGLGTARGAVELLARGSSQALTGVRQVGSGLSQARSGVSAGVPSIRTLRDGLESGASGLERLRQPVQTAQGSLKQGLDYLDQMLPTSKADPHYDDVYRAVAKAYGAISGKNPQTGQPVAPGYSGLDAALAQASDQARAAAAGVGQILSRTVTLESGLSRLISGTDRLERGIAQLDSGNRKLLAGFGQLTGGGDALTGGLGRLVAGSGALAGGVGQLRSGAGALAQGIEGGQGRVGSLSAGLERMRHGVLVFRSKTAGLSQQSGQLDRLTPAFDSGYFTLAVLDKQPHAARESAGFALNLERGGTTGRILVVGYGNAQKAGHPLRKVLAAQIPRLERATDSTAALDGVATGLQDFDNATASRLPLLAITLVLATYLVLVVVLRSLLLPFLAVVLNLLTVAAAFGALVVLFQGHNPLLGGPGFVDAVTSFGIFAIMFGLSIDYEVFLMTRMVEGHELTGTTAGAIEYGVQRTAGVVTGAALCMTGVFVAFALTDIAATREFGVGLTIAVLLDATLVRLVLLPGAIKLCGDRTWWLPRWLERTLPGRRSDVSARTTRALS